MNAHLLTNCSSLDIQFCRSKPVSNFVKAKKLFLAIQEPGTDVMIF
jgi:hypothetical protein